MGKAASLDAALLQARLGTTKRHGSIRPLYGDGAWAQDLDIVNELGGHSGCVNALRYRPAQEFLHAHVTF
jgi:DDB1- and CUL4-associated factor 6